MTLGDESVMTLVDESVISLPSWSEAERLSRGRASAQMLAFGASAARACHTLPVPSPYTRVTVPPFHRHSVPESHRPTVPPPQRYHVAGGPHLTLQHGADAIALPPVCQLEARDCNLRREAVAARACHVRRGACGRWSAALVAGRTK